MSSAEIASTTPTEFLFIEAASARLERKPVTSITSTGSSVCAVAGKMTTVPSITDTALFTIDCLNVH